MKITKSRLKQIIKEEIEALDINESDDGGWSKYSRATGSEPRLPRRDYEDPLAAAEAELEPMELDPETLAWIDNLIKKPDGLEQLQAIMKSMK